MNAFPVADPAHQESNEELMTMGPRFGNPEDANIVRIGTVLFGEKCSSSTDRYVQELLKQKAEIALDKMLSVL